MKFFCKIFLLLIFSCVNIFSQWYPQTSNTIYPLKSVYFIDANTGLICGWGLVLKTTDSGSNWNSTSLYSRQYNSIIFTDNNTGWLSGDSGAVYKTTNAGTNWNPINSGTYKNLMNITFLNQSTGLIAGFSRTILKTTNAGLNWLSMISNIDTLDFLGCEFINENNYVVTGTTSAIYRSTDAGASWIHFAMGLVNPLWAAEFINDNTGWVTGCCGMLTKTTNAGANWSPEILLSVGNTFYTMAFINSTTGYMSGDNGFIFRTTNQGENWYSTSTGTNQILYSFFMANANTGWAVGNYGTILKTTNGGGPGFTIGINPISGEIPKEFLLEQNYPNPFNPKTIINFKLSRGNGTGGITNYVSLKVYDLLGNEVSVLVNENLNAGTYEVVFDASNLSSGVYYYRIEAGSFVDSKKMILIK